MDGPLNQDGVLPPVHKGSGRVFMTFRGLHRPDPPPPPGCSDQGLMPRIMMAMGLGIFVVAGFALGRNRVSDVASILL